ncbi:MAG TPA: hypothetical protein VH087_06620 [Thermoanaerobaculia bacterium]|nr:hypothetical protein [Thermoanaerobaculia bacterium]
MKQITIILFALVIVYPVFGCDTPHGNAVATPQTVTDCSYLAGAIGLNEQSAVGIFAWSSFGFGSSSGAVTVAPVTLNGGFTKLQSTVDQVIANPLMATDGSNFLLVEYSSGTTATRLVHADGTFGPRSAIVTVSNANAAGATQNDNGGSASVVWDGTEYLVLTTEFVRPAADVAAVPKVVSATVRADGTLASSGVIADKAVLLTAVKAGSSAVAIWKTNGTVQAGFAVPQQIVSNPITLAGFDGNGAAAANNGSQIAVVFADNAGVDLLLADTNFNNRSVKTVNSANASGLAIVADGSDFLVAQSDSNLNARATRISGGNPGATFTLTSGAVVSAASNSRGTIILSTHGCGTIASQFVARGSTSPSTPTDLTLKGSPQTDERLVSTSNGHQLTYIENHSLYTQFVDNTANAQPRTQLTAFAAGFAMTELNGGSAVAWVDGSLAQSIKVARFDAADNKRGSTIDVPVASATVNFLAIAASGDSVLVAFQATPLGSHHAQVIATIIDSTGTPAPTTLLSGLSDDGTNLTAGVNGSSWMVTWRNGPPNVMVVITTPVSTLLSPSRRDIPMTTTGLPALVLADSGNVYWIDRGAQNVVHKTVVSSGADSVIGQSSDNIDTVRLLSGIPVWTVRTVGSGETTTTLASPLSTVACFVGADSGVEYDTRDNGVSMWVYTDGTQLRTQLLSTAPPASRHRAVHH